MYAYENIEMSLNYIEQHLSEKIETEKLAEIACLSTFYYQRLFKRLVKRSVQEYIKLRRLAMVIAELNNSEERILDIALKYGFSDHANFTRAFKEVYHITPDEYRKNVPMLNTFDKVIWQCVTATKKGKKFCKHSKGIPETAIEEAFVESYRLLCDDNKDVLEEFLQRMDDTLSSSVVSKQLAKAEKEIGALEKKKSKLVDMRLEEIIDKETYESKYADLVSKQEQLVEERKKLQETSDNEKDIKKRLKEFKKTLEQNEVLDKFDRYVFESIVEKVIVGGLDENGNVDPAQLTFVYKTGLKNNVDGAKFKPQRKNARGRHRTEELCSHDSNEVDKMCSDSSNDTYREYGVDTKGQYLKILEFKRFVKHFSFKKISETYSQKELLEEITVVVALDVVERDTRNPSFINESKSSDR